MDVFHSTTSFFDFESFLKNQKRRGGKESSLGSVETNKKKAWWREAAENFKRDHKQVCVSP